MVRGNAFRIPMYLIISIVLFITTTTCFVDSKTSLERSITNDLLQFLEKNGKTFLTFASLDQEQLEVKEMLRNLARSSKLVSKLRSRVLALDDFDTTHRFHKDTLVLLATSTSKNWKTYIDIITKTKIMSCVVVCIGKQHRGQLEELTASLQNESPNAFFYFIGAEADDIEVIDWKKIMSIKNSKKALVTPMKFDSFGRVKRETDLNGLHINCSTLSWRPWFKLSNCKGKNDTNCSGVGYLADVMNFLGYRYNFTWSCDAEPNGVWGHERPLSGPRNASGSWGGVFGNVANGTYPLCVSVWHYMGWRNGLADFSAVSSGEKFFAAYFPSSPNYDPGLFFRPFTLDSWAVGGTMSLLILSIVFYGHWFEKGMVQEREGRQAKLAGIKLTIIVGWTFFVLTWNGFYDGALTMFFAKETPAAFETESQILEAYPTWIYNVRRSAATVMYNGAEENKLYQEFIALMEENLEKFTYKNVEEGVQRIKSGQIAMRAGDRTLRQYYKEHPYESRPNTINIPQGGTNSRNLMLTDNSPLLPLFRTGSIELWEIGLLKGLEEKWMGKKLKGPISDPLHTVVLSLGQLMLIFSILSAAILVSIIILGIELSWNYMVNLNIFEH